MLLRTQVDDVQYMSRLVDMIAIAVVDRHGSVVSIPDISSGDKLADVIHCVAIMT